MRIQQSASDCYKFRLNNLILLLCCVLFTSILSAEEVTVTASGADQNAALRNALREAVVRVAAENIDSVTFATNKPKILSKLSEKPQQYVTSHTTDTIWSTFGLTFITCTVNVSIGNIEDDLVRAKISTGYMIKPRIIVLLEEQQGNTILNEKTATFIINKKLVDQGFKVIESEQAREIQATYTDMSDSALAASSFASGADLIVRGILKASPSVSTTIYDVNFSSVTVQANAQIVEASTAAIYAASSRTITRKAMDPFSALQVALKTGADTIASSLLVDLLKFQTHPSYREQRISLCIRNCGTGDLEVIEHYLKSHSSVRSTKVRYIKDGLAVVDADIRGSMQTIRETFADMKEPACVIDQMTFNSLSIHIQNKSDQPTSNIQIFSPLEIKQFTIAPIFPSLIRHYESHPLTHISISDSNNSIQKYTLKVVIPEIMTAPVTRNIDVVNRTGEQIQKIPLPLDIKRVFENKNTRQVLAQATIDYVQNKKNENLTVTTPVIIHETNAMDWHQPATIASFVTYRNPDIISFATKIVQLADIVDTYKYDFFNGIAIFQLLKQLKISYLKDPRPLSTLMQIDRVQFPVETINRRGGDCDDLSVLYAALLSAVGIETAIIVYPEHVQVLFNTGIFEKNKHLLGIEDSMIVMHKGTVWIPVETTMPAVGFIEAWHSASQQYRNSKYDNRNIQIIELTEVWNHFPPAPVSGSVTGSFSISETKASIENEIEKINKSTIDFLETKLELLIGNVAAQGNDSIKVQFLNQAGIIEVRLGKYNAALKRFYESKSIKNSIGTQSNIAATQLLCGETKQASAIFDTLFKKTRDVKIGINRAIALFSQANTKEKTDVFINAMKDVSTLLNDQTLLNSYFGVLLTDVSLEKGSIENSSVSEQINMARLKELLWAHVIDCKQIYITGTTSETSTGSKLSGTTTEASTGSLATDEKQVASEAGGIKSADPMTTITLRELMIWFE
ncbi:MAG: hypothetical protein JW915_08610 [Chitinispirillaceae bacterium]|nr:hypothetical protein [Chitinispirillaceae bacterium]